MTIQRGQVYYVDFDQIVPRTQEKCRPAVVVQNDAGNSHSPYTIVAAIKHSNPKTLPVLVEVPRGEAGLTKDSVVDCGQIHTVLRDDLFGYAGRLSPDRMLQVDKALAISLGLRWR